MPNMKYIFILLTVAIGCGLSTACSKTDSSIATLQASGYANVQLTGYRFMGCPRDDSFHTGFVAKTSNGNQVSGVVCSGWLMGSSIHLD